MANAAIHQPDKSEVEIVEAEIVEIEKTIENARQMLEELIVSSPPNPAMHEVLRTALSSFGQMVSAMGHSAFGRGSKDIDGGFILIPKRFGGSLEHFFEAAQAQGRNEELVVSILQESADLLKKREPRGGALSDDQVAFLIESGDFTEEEFAETEASVARGDLAEEERKTRLEAVTASLSAAEVAEQLGVDASRVRHRQAKGSLYSFMVGGKRRYPLWQFTGNPAQAVLPGLATVVNAIPEGMHPASVQGFMTTPQESLLVNDERVTPAEWLQHGGAPQALVQILDSMLQS